MNIIDLIILATTLQCFFFLYSSMIHIFKFFKIKCIINQSSSTICLTKNRQQHPMMFNKFHLSTNNSSLFCILVFLENVKDSVCEMIIGFLLIHSVNTILHLLLLFIIEVEPLAPHS